VCYPCGVTINYDDDDKIQYSLNFVIVAIIYVLHLHQMSAQYKNINTKVDKSILCNESCDNDKVNLGQVRFLMT